MSGTSFGDSNPLLIPANPAVGVSHAAVKTLVDGDGMEKAALTSLVPGYVLYDIFTNGSDSLVGRLGTNLYNNTPFSIMTSEDGKIDSHPLLTVSNPVVGVGHAAIKTLVDGDGMEKAALTSLIPGYALYDICKNGLDSLVGRLGNNILNNTPLGSIFSS